MGEQVVIPLPRGDGGLPDLADAGSDQGFLHLGVRPKRRGTLLGSPWPKTRSCSYLMPRWPLRSMWNSLPW